MELNRPDTVEIYLKEVSALPLMPRREEVRATRRLATLRNRFQRTLLANDYVLRRLVRRLEETCARGLRVDQVVNISQHRPVPARLVRKRLADSAVRGLAGSPTRISKTRPWRWADWRRRLPPGRHLPG